MSVGVPEPLWDGQLESIFEPAADWLWQGMIARGNLTLFTGQWKGGKTTLLSMLLARRNGGGALAGLDVRPGKTALISEERPALWRERGRKYNFGGLACFFAQPFVALPQPEEWQALVDRVLRLHTEEGVDLVIIDPLGPFLRAENNPRSVLETLLPLGALTRRGMARRS
jgi:hypothetical protein